MQSCIVIDSYGGICNQFTDIASSVNFALRHNSRFCFRHCSYRNPGLNSWTSVPFGNLFDEAPYTALKGWISFQEIDQTDSSTWNAESKRLVEHNITYEQLIALSAKQQFMVLKQMSAIVDWEATSSQIAAMPNPKPSEKVAQKYNEISASLPEYYNYLAYRYERDFVSHMSRFHPGTRFPLLQEILEAQLYSEQSLPLYLACSSPKELSTPHTDSPIELIPNLLYCDEQRFTDTNYEVGAFVDFLVGLNAQQVFGHSRSSFSRALNGRKRSSNYYDEKL